MNQNNSSQNQRPPSLIKKRYIRTFMSEQKTSPEEVVQRSNEKDILPDKIISQKVTEPYQKVFSVPQN